LGFSKDKVGTVLQKKSLLIKVAYDASDGSVATVWLDNWEVVAEDVTPTPEVEDEVEAVGRVGPGHLMRRMSASQAAEVEANAQIADEEYMNCALVIYLKSID
jgi:hypothetical protein